MSAASTRSPAALQRDRAIAAALERWFAANARDLPWREPTRDPWRALVSEFMLQQTQASRVAARYPGFVRTFPTPAAMARAGEERVLAAWSGMGYYRRARLLHGAAVAIVEGHDGRTPRTSEALRALPGVGRYTAGAVASIACGERAPIVDANVARVILRLEGRALPVRDGAAQTLAWERADALVHASNDPGAFNEALMELGALVCTPRAPACDACPVRTLCVAAAEGTQNGIPAPTVRAERREVHHAAVLIRDGRGRVLVERRPERGLWAGLWQAPTLEDDRRSPGARRVSTWLGAGPVRLQERFDVATTHRIVRFSVWSIRGDGAAPDAIGGAPTGARVWKSPAQVRALALASPHRRMLLGV